MKDSLSQHLIALFEEHCGDLPGVSRRRMFGCETFFRGGWIFGLIWKDGRIGLKLMDPASFDEAITLEGADRWKPVRAEIARWVLLPESFHDDVDALSLWIRRAHAQANDSPGKAPRRLSKAKPRPKPRQGQRHR